MPPPDPPGLLHPFFTAAARRHPDRIALEVPPGTARPGRQTLTYAELAAASDRLALHLRPYVSEGAFAAILLPRSSPGLFIAQLAVLEAGAAFACLDPSFPDEHCRFLLEDVGTAVLLTDRDSLKRAATLGSMPILDVAGPLAGGGGGAPPPPWLTPASLAYAIYTSGTTGRPKGVMVEHRSLANLVASDLAEFRLGPGDRVAQGSSAAYDSSLEETWLALAAGATLVAMDDETARLGPDLVPWLRRERITVLCPTPTLLRTLGRIDPATALPELRLVYTGGEALPQDLADLWARGRRLENGYGPTECAVTVLRGPVREGMPVTIGRPIPPNRAWVLDAALAEVPEGEAGELCLGGVCLARGYRKLPGLTAERFPLHPRFGRIYRTGDLVRRNQDGDYLYLGRIDSQVKLRGYRIELEAIEARLAECPGVREAACRVQGEGVERHLAAFVVPADPAAPPDLDGLKAQLAAVLPVYMVPSRLGLLPRLPTTTGGKLDRRALPEIEAPARAAAVVAPRDELEARVAGVIQGALDRRGPISVDDDFFLDLGGDSLAAAVTISNLRDDGATAALTVRDLYEARTVAGLARRVRAQAGEPAPLAGEAAPPAGRPLPAALLQGAWLLAGLLAGAGLAWLAGFHLLPFLARTLGLAALLLLSPLLGAAGLAAYTVLAVGLAAGAKRLLIGRYRATTAPVWGSLYLRNWMVQQAVRLVPWGLLQGTVLTGAVLRALGARVGRRVHIHRGVNLLRGGWDLLELGDDATLAQEASLRLVDLEDGRLVVGPVTVGAGGTVDVRAGLSAHSAVGAGAFLTALSWLPPGSRIPDGELWDGVPAGPAGPAAPPPPPPAGAGVLTPAGHGALLILARLGTRALFAAPLLLLLLGLALALGLDAAGALAWLVDPDAPGSIAGPLLAVVIAANLLSLLLQALFLRALGEIRPGVISRWSPAYIRVWLKAGVVQAAGEWLSGTLFWPLWLRLAGMRIGRRCEISTILDVPPERVEVGFESFLADGIYLGCPRVQGGTVTIASTRLGRNTFLGNHVVVHAGQSLPDGVLLGVCTVADDAVVRPGTSWFGHPAFELPRREIVPCDRRLTHEPGPVRFLTRLAWESARFLMPAVPLLALLAWFKALEAAGRVLAGPALWLAAVPGLTLGLAGSLCLLVLALKWLLLGRVRPGQHPLWSCWCSRWDFLYVAWNLYASRFLAFLEGTPFLPWYLRAMGVRIGRGVVLGGAFAQVVDPDMLAFEDGATVNGLFQAHTFEDRVLKIDRVKIRSGATVGGGAVLFYGADVGARARVAPHSVVMKRERLLPGRCYAGAPTRLAGPAPVRPGRGPAPRPPAREPEPERLAAIDAARGLAVLAMIYVHLVPTEGGQTAWEAAATALGRLVYDWTAPLFCFLAGFAWALQTRRISEASRLDRYLGRRALALILAGLLFGHTLWPTEILAPMGLMMLGSMVVLRLGSRALLPAALVLLAAAPAVCAWMAEYAESDWLEDGTHLRELGLGWVTLRYFLLDGHYPLVPWLLFPLAGIAFARAAWTRRRAGRAFLLFLPAAVAAHLYAAWAEAHEEALGAWAGHLQSVWTPTTIPFLAVGATAAAAVASGLLWWQLAGRGWPWLLRLAAALGRTSLTHYVLHIGLAYTLLEAIYTDEEWSVGAGLIGFAAYLAAAVPATLWWLRRHARGPLEALLALASGRRR